MSQVSKTEVAKRPRIRVPHTYVLITFIILVAALMTYIIPAGKYDMVEDPNTGRMIVDANSFTFTERQPITLMKLLMAIPEGLNASSRVIFTSFIMGGAFKIIFDTGSVDAGINAAIRKFQNKALLVIPMLIIMMAFFGAAGTMIGTAVAVIPVGMTIARRLNLDPILGMSMIFLGSFSGFAVSPFSPLTTVLAQEIAGLPILSGIQLRTIMWIILVLVTAMYVYRYAKKVSLDISQSAMGEFTFDSTYDVIDDSGDFTIRDKFVIILFVAGFATYIYGALKLKWGVSEMGAIMLPTAVIAGLVGKMDLDSIANSFIQGCKGMTFGALIVGFARAISIVLEQGQIIHSIIYYMSIPLQKAGPILSSIGMFYINLVFNLFVPSGSGQAMIVMPIMAPLADLTGISRQIAVSAFQFGDGMSNIIIPTSGELLGCLGVAGIAYNKWVKWVAPLFLIWVALGTLFMIMATAIAWI